MLGFNKSRALCRDVTARTLDVGQLVMAGAGPNSFGISQAKLRVSCASQLIRTRRRKSVKWPKSHSHELAGRPLRGECAELPMTRHSRTLLTELEVAQRKRMNFSVSICAGALH